MNAAALPIAAFVLSADPASPDNAKAACGACWLNTVNALVPALQAQGIDVDVVGGTSIGAIMGMLVACDQPGAMQQALDLIEAALLRPERT